MIEAVHQEPQRRDQDQRERQGPDEQTEREPSGQEPTRATLVAVVRVEQDVDPVAPLALLTDPDLGLTPGFHGPVARVARPVAQPPVVSLVAEVVSHGTTIVPPVGCSLAAGGRSMGAGTVTFSEVMEKVTRGFETVGVAILVIGIAVAFIRAVLDLRREDAHRAYSRLRQDMGRSILLGLEVLIAADLVRTVTIDPDAGERDLPRRHRARSDVPELLVGDRVGRRGAVAQAADGAERGQVDAGTEPPGRPGAVASSSSDRGPGRPGPGSRRWWIRTARSELESPSVNTVAPRPV